MTLEALQLTASGIGPGGHAVLFFEDEQFVPRAVTSFFAEPLRTGEPMVMISRRRVFDAVTAELDSRRGPAGAPSASRIVFVDVETALGSVMTDDGLSPARFEQGFGAVIAEAREQGPGTIWVYGELVDLLCKMGHHAMAVRVEELWNLLFGGSGYAVMCSYALQDFDTDLLANHFRAICRQHTHVIPTEGFTGAADERARFEQVACLQQRVRALAGALAHEAPAVPDSIHPATASTIYVIDDDTSVRRSIGRLLSSVDLRAETFGSAEEFLSGVAPASPGCLIMDVQLVGMSGSDLQRSMTKSGCSMPIIAMSGSHDAQLEAEVLRLGAHTFLRKPFEAQALLDAIASALQTRKTD
jgi:CheY-like chemotaxis protein